MLLWNKFVENCHLSHQLQVSSRAPRSMDLLFLIFDNLLSHKQLAIERNWPQFGSRGYVLSVYRVHLTVKFQGHSEVNRCIYSFFPTFNHFISGKRLFVERNRPQFGPRRQVLSVYRITSTVKCLRSIWGHSVDFQFSTALYLENGWL